MSGADKVKASALAALAGRTATAGRISADTRWHANPYEVRLTRIRPPRDLTSRSSTSEPSNPTQQSTALHD
jgi:hypothetical protein